MKILCFILLSALAVAQEVPNAPSGSRECRTNDENGKFVQIPCDTVPSAEYVKTLRIIEDNPPKHESWVRRHPRKTEFLIILGGVGIGSFVAYETRLGSCAKFYDGKPYSGTPPCPK